MWKICEVEIFSFAANINGRMQKDFGAKMSQKLVKQLSKNYLNRERKLVFLEAFLELSPTEMTLTTSAFFDSVKA